MTLESTGRSGAREVRIVAVAPGSGLPRAATFDYREVYRPAGKALWDLAVYAYEYRTTDGGRRAYHLHDREFHAHCVDPRDPGRSHHYRATEIDLFEAHDEFRSLYLSQTGVSCGDLRPALPGAER